MKLISNSLEQTNEIAKRIAKNKKSKIILIDGEIGSGKTTLVQFIGKELGVKEKITSPTFNIMHVFDEMVHIDAYRIKGSLNEFVEFFEDKFVVIEWAKNISWKFENSIHVDCYIESDKHVYEVNEDV